MTAVRGKFRKFVGTVDQMDFSYLKTKTKHTRTHNAAFRIIKGVVKSTQDGHKHVAAVISGCCQLSLLPNFICSVCKLHCANECPDSHTLMQIDTHIYPHLQIT